MKLLLSICLLTCLGTHSFAQKAEDRNAILKLAGTFKVSFKFIETYSNDSNYKLAKNYTADALEMVVVTENSKNKISLSHFLLVNDSVVVKHWRQDWIYENTDFLNYQGNNSWTKYSLPKNIVKGTWTQKVFQVDESPRYEAYGFWVKEGNEMVWQASACNSPLPRRELLVREDYNIMKRRSRIVVGDNYWYLEQDNNKMKGDTMICHEKGMETFTRTSFETSAITKYWSKNSSSWLLLISEWNKFLASNEYFHLPGQLIRTDYHSEVYALIKKLNQSELNEQDKRKEVQSFLEKYCKTSSSMTVK